MQNKDNKKILLNALKNLNAFDYFLILSILGLSIFKVTDKFLNGQPLFETLIAAISASLGVFCVVLGAKGSIANWFFGIIEAILHIFICFQTHIYGDFLQRVFYNLPMQFVGLKKWKKRETTGETSTIKTRYMTWKQRFYTLLAVVTGTILLANFLIYFGPWFVGVIQTILPDFSIKTEYDAHLQLWLDSFTTVMSIIAMWISVKAFVEQWYIWLVINIAYIIMWTLSDSAFSFMTVAKYVLYFINSFYGIYTWHKLTKAKLAAEQ